MFNDNARELRVHLIFGWKYSPEFVEAIKATAKQAADGDAAVPPPPFPLPEPLTEDAFKHALLVYARCETATTVGTTVLRGMSHECSRALVRLHDLNYHPWIQHVIAVGGADKVLPVAQLYVVKDLSGRVVPALDPRPGGLWNCPPRRDENDDDDDEEGQEDEESKH